MSGNIEISNNVQEKSNKELEEQKQEEGQKMHEATASTSTSTSASTKQLSGININEAMSILSTRADNGSEKELHQIDPQLKEMGQTLDFMSTQEWTKTENQCGHNSSPLVMHERQEMAKQSQQNQNPQNEDNDNTDSNSKNDSNSKSLELKETLSKQTPYELLQTLFKIQNERVMAYQKFNQGLEKVLKSGNFSLYTTIATNVTATFVVLSNSIREIQHLFKDDDKLTTKSSSISVKDCKEIASFIQQLQSHEKDQLHLTAALHLEKLREQNELIDMNIGGINSGSDSGNERIANLLRDSISSLQGKIAECVENINDVLEELRYAAADINEA